MEQLRGQLEQLRTDVNTVAKTTDGKLGKSDNLSDLKDKETARNNLQLGKKILSGMRPWSFQVLYRLLISITKIVKLTTPFG